MLHLRFFTALIGIPIFLGALYLGELWWAALLAVIAWLGAGESFRLAMGKGSGQWFSRLAALSILALAYSSSGDGVAERASELLVPGMTAALTVAIAFHALSPAASEGLAGAGKTVIAAVYPGIFLAQLLLLRTGGTEAVLLAVLVTWATDTGAYAVGSAFGRRPLWPAVSPKKTVEGSVGGAALGVGVGFLLAAIWEKNLWAWGSVALTASIAAQLGDLVESGMKRRANLKDSGSILPGHGGVLDRFDSLLFSGSAVYYLQSLLG